MAVSNAESVERSIDEKSYLIGVRQASGCQIESDLGILSMDVFRIGRKEASHTEQSLIVTPWNVQPQFQIPKMARLMVS